MQCTAYTSLIASGEVKTAKDFLKVCLRQFGVLVDVIGEPLSKDIKFFALEQLLRTKPDSTKFLEEKIAMLRNMTWEEYAAEKIEACKKSIEYAKETLTAEEKRVKERQEFLDGFLEEIVQIGE